MAPERLTDPATADSRRLLVYRLLMLRGLCILAVILIHVTSGLSQMTRTRGLTGVLLFTNALGGFAVPLFITFSGFYLSLNSRNENAGFFYRRTLRLLIIPYVAYSLLYSLLKIRTMGSPWRLLENLFLARAYSHLWFSLMILQLYLLHPYLARWYRACRRRGTLVTAAVLLQISWGLGLAFLFPASGSWATPDLLARSGGFYFRRASDIS